MRPVLILRIDPNRRTVAAMTLKAANDATPQIRKLTKASRIGSREIMQVDGAPLMALGGLDVDEEMQGWRLPGTEDTAGIGILTGRNPENNRLIGVPVTRAWVLERIQWLDGEDVEGRDDRADEMLPALNSDVEAALKAAFVMPTGEMWITAEHKAIVGDAMLTLGLGTERSGGQMLTKLGESVHDKLLFGGVPAAEDF